MEFLSAEHMLSLSIMACLSLMVSFSQYFVQNSTLVNCAEPGYYEDGAFGVRIENVELIKDVETKYNFHGVQFMTMEPLTLVSNSMV